MKTSRYIKYALGEIVLVVIGILIALSINNWNESRKQLTLENQTIESLKAELKANIALMENVKTFHQFTLDTLNLFIGNRLEMDTDRDKARIIVNVAGFLPLKINAPVMSQELGNDNKIKKRTTIIEKLRSLDFQYQNYASAAVFLDEFWNREYIPYMVEEGHMTSVASGYLTQQEPTDEFIRLFDDQAYKNLISAHGMLLLSMLQSQTTALAESEKLLKYLNENEDQ